jgi:dihydroorotate dehydrogenase (NAD+) catalytic subunit
MVWQTAQRVSIPIIGMGGISKWEDAVEMFVGGRVRNSSGNGQFYGRVYTVENNRRH